MTQERVPFRRAIDNNESDSVGGTGSEDGEEDGGGTGAGGRKLIIEGHEWISCPRKRCLFH